MSQTTHLVSRASPTCTHARMTSGRGEFPEKYVWAHSPGFRVLSRNIGLTNQQRHICKLPRFQRENLAECLSPEKEEIAYSSKFHDRVNFPQENSAYFRGTKTCRECPDAARGFPPPTCHTRMHARRKIFQ